MQSSETNLFVHLSLNAAGGEFESQLQQKASQIKLIVDQNLATKVTHHETTVKLITKDNMAELTCSAYKIHVKICSNNGYSQLPEE